MKKGDFIKIKDIGIGKIENIWDKKDIQINICDTMYYRDLTEDRLDIGNAEPSNEKEYIEFIKLMIKELSATSKTKRNEASEYNKQTNGYATKRKGKVLVMNGNIYGLCENSISRYHSSLLSDAKKAKELRDKLKKELAWYEQRDKLIKEAEKARKNAG